MNDELNKKLALWAGFGQLPKANRGFHYQQGARVMNWMPSGKTEWWESREYLPNFTESLDACFKWLVLPLLHKDNDYNKDFDAYYNTGRDDYYKIMFLWHQALLRHDQEPALALCLAIEKLIDSGED